MELNSYVATSPADLPKLRRGYMRFRQLSKKSKLYKEKAALYRTPNGFTGWRDILSGLIIQSSVLETAIKSRSQMDIEQCIAAKQALLDDSPLRHLDRELGESFLRTALSPMEPPPLAFDHLIINLPNGLLLDDWGAPIRYLLVSSMSSFRNCLHKSGIRTVGSNDFDGLEIVGVNDCGLALIDTTPWEKIGKQLALAPGNIGRGWEDEIQDACMKMQRLAVNSLLAMAYKPEMVTTEAVTASLSGSGFKLNAKQQHTRDVVWIGKGFTRTARVRNASDDSDGAPKASHWRSGHWHTVRHGKGKQLSRLDWYQPIYVNPGASA